MPPVPIAQLPPLFEALQLAQHHPAPRETPPVRIHHCPEPSPGFNLVAVQIFSASGRLIGAMGVMNAAPDRLTPDHQQSLVLLAQQAEAWLAREEHQSNLDAVRLNQARTARALEESESFYHSLVETLPQNIFRKDVEGRFTFANRRFCESHGKALLDIIGKTDFDLFPNELAQKYALDDRKVLDQGETIETVEAHAGIGGDPAERRYVHVIKSPILDESRRIIGIQGIFWDVTERKRIEEDLAYERDLLRSLLDNIPDSIYFKDTQSRFIRISKSLAQRCRLKDPSDAIDKTDFDLFGKDHASEAYRDEQHILLTGSPMIGKLERETLQDGSHSWVISSKLPLRSKSGSIIGTFGISKDITDLKRTEEELAKARDAALESAKLKSQFLANMSHEIRTPMNGVIGMTDLLLDTELTAEQLEFAETIRVSANSLLTIINDILDFSKVESRGLVFKPADFDLTRLIESTIDIVAPKAQAKNIELGLDLDPSLPLHLHGDADRIRQVLTNLLANALKFTEQGHVSLAASAQTTAQGRVLLSFRITDTGIGIPEEFRPRIFQAFSQADGSLTRRYGGTGLGLAICKELIDQMHGSIDYTSTPGTGTTFTVTVLLDPPGVRPPEEFNLGHEMELSGVKVLVLDASPFQRNLVQKQIERLGASVTGASSLPEARAQIILSGQTGDPFHCLVADSESLGSKLPDLMRALGPIASAPTAVKILLLTPFGWSDAHAMMSTRLVSACVPKPVKPTQLREALLFAAPPASPDATLFRRKPAANPLMPGPTTGPRLRVLLAEDNEVNQKVALRQLAKLECDVDTASTGHQVLVALQRERYDLILMDCQMPEMDGYETTRAVRQQERATAAKPVRIVAMTANAMAGDREKCLAAGMDDYLSKPVQFEGLRTVLRQATRTAQAAGPEAVAPPTPASPTTAGSHTPSHPAGPRPASNPTPLGPALDESILAELRDLSSPGETNPLDELIDLFLGETGAQLALIQRALPQRDLKAVAAAAASLQASASNLGAREFGERARLIETWATGTGTQPHDTPRLLEDLQRAFQRVQARLEAERTPRPPLASHAPQGSVRTAEPQLKS